MKIINSIKSKSIASLILFALVFIAIFVSNIIVSSGEKSDSLIINLAGRQRMLSQKILKESLAYLFLPQSNKIKKEAIQNTITLFEKSLSALTNGGETFSDLGMKKKVILPSNRDIETKTQLNQVKELWENFKKTMMGLIDTRGNNQQEIEKLLDSNIEVLKAMDAAVGIMQIKAESKINNLMWIQIIGFALFILIGILFLSMIRGSLLKPIATMIATFEKVSEGDLTAEIKSSGNDEISHLGESFNKVVNNLSQIIRQVKKSSHEVAMSTDEISNGSSELSTRTNEEAASITETSATLEELTDIVKQNKTNAEEIGSSLIFFNEEIQSSSELMTNVTNTMHEIHESGRKIDAIVNVINDISFQTNLLALNAAVEAARAGDAGRGFAVVAAEVRNLAQKTAESSKTIQAIVFQNVESTTRGMDLVKQTTDFFSTITQVMQEIVSRIEQITEGSKQQATGVEQINISVNQLENVINQNAALVEELSATTKNMKSNSFELQKLVDRFSVSSETQKTKTTAPNAKKQPTVAKKTPIEKKPTVEKKAPVEKKTAPEKTITPKESQDDFFKNDDEFEEF